MRDETREFTPAVIADRTRAYVRENFLYMRPDWPLKDEDPLFGGGVIDSIGVIELSGFCSGSSVARWKRTRSRNGTGARSPRSPASSMPSAMAAVSEPREGIAPLALCARR